MLRRLFAAFSSRPSNPQLSRRLELEALEERLVLDSAMAGLPPGPYASGGSFSYGPGSSIVQAPGDMTSYPSIYLEPFGYSPEAEALASLGAGLPVGLNPYSPTSLNVSQAVSSSGATSGGLSAAAANQLAQVGQVIGNLAQMAASESSPQLTLNLAIDEFFQAADTYALLHSQAQGISNANTASIQGSLTAHESAIAHNPADHTPAGQMLGTAVFDATLYLLAANQGSV